MANTITQTTLFGDSSSKKVVRSIIISSDGTEETDLVIFDNSAFIADATKGKVVKVWHGGDYTGSLLLEWDQTTDSPIVALGKEGGWFMDFSSFGGIPNPNGTGATGDIILTSRELANLDDFCIILEIDQS